MRTIVHLHGKPVRIELTKAAQRALKELAAPLIAEIHLIFGCLIVKRVRFHERATPDAVPVSDRLKILFRSVRYQKSCRLSDIDGDEVPSDFPLVADKSAFVPQWLTIDYRGGQWTGDYGYRRSLTFGAP